MKKFFAFIVLVFFYLSIYAESLRVASFNLRMDTAKDAENAWEYRKDFAKDLINFYAFDICATQEGFKHQLDYLTGDASIYAYIGIAREDGKETGEHSAIIYNKKRVKLLKNGDFWFSETPAISSLGWDAACKRICSWAKFKDSKSGKEFFFFSLHLDHKGALARENSSKLLLEKIRIIAGNSTVIIAGDFNSLPSDKPVAQILKGGFFDAFKISDAKPYGPIYTFHRFEGLPVVTDSGVSTNESRIDYIFTSKAVSVLKYATISDNNCGKYPSDHFPIMADINIE